MPHIPKVASCQLLCYISLMTRRNSAAASCAAFFKTAAGRNSNLEGTKTNTWPNDDEINGGKSSNLSCSSKTPRPSWLAKKFWKKYREFSCHDHLPNETMDVPIIFSDFGSVFCKLILKCRFFEVGKKSPTTCYSHQIWLYLAPSSCLRVFASMRASWVLRRSTSQVSAIWLTNEFSIRERVRWLLLAVFFKKG